MTIENFQQAITSTRGVLENVTADQMSLPTPCASWDVSALINHIVSVHYFMKSTMEGTEITGQDVDYAAGDYMAAYDEATSISLAAATAEGALDRTVSIGPNEMPAQAFMGIATNDAFVHGWDLAKATGQPTDLAPDLAAEILAQAQALIPDAFRGPEGAPFGPKAESPEGAGAADRLAAFCGREI